MTFHLQVVDKFYEIRQHSLEGFEDTSWDNKFACLLHDSEELWSYNDSSTSKYIVSSQDLIFCLFLEYPSYTLVLLHDVPMFRIAVPLF